MTETKYDVLTVGNAIVDIIARAEDDFLVAENINKGSMNLIDEPRAEALYAAMGPAIETSGGSAGNTAAGIASFGGSVAYFGKVADDHLGKVFTHDMRAIGAHYETSPLVDGEATARSMIFVTPDGERSMNTYLGACVRLNKSDIDPAVVAATKVTYFEGYLWDPPEAKEAIREAARIAHDNDRLVSMTLSDSFCVDRYRSEFLDLMKSGTVDITFGNEAELQSLYQTSDLSSAVDAVRNDCHLTIITRGPKGCMVVSREQTQEIDAHPIKERVDTTGAGDLFAAGFLHGMTSGRSLVDCGRLGGIAAAEVIEHIGPRPQASLRGIAEQLGL